MSGVVSYDLFKSRFGSSNTGITPEGGIYETFINKTGAPSIKGTIVVAYTGPDAVDNAVSIAPDNSSAPIGIIYEDGIDNGSAVKVVVYGKAEVLMLADTDSNRGWWCGVGTTGRMYQSATEPITDLSVYSREIGHCLESKTGGPSVLVLVQIHFN